ncbi:glycerophosphodiester phosphodiesterase, partial [Myxococcota bacterium]|nr:glycerophosphodiester phosphodiesterase [Myxococcota bacterium]
MSKNSIVFPSLELPLNIAHRGASMQAPENTFMAFELATTLGAHVLELDVYLSRDGEVVVFHDETLERTTNGEGPLAALSLNELQALDAAYHFKTQQGENPFRNRGIFMPRLVEVLRAFPEMSFNIESKGKDPALVDAL